MDQRSFLLRVHLCTGVGMAGENRLYQFLKIYQRAPHAAELAQLFSGTHSNLRKFLHDFHSEKISQQMEANRRQTGILTILDDQYPPQLREIYQPPLVLFYRGQLNLLKPASLAVVGARKMTSYVNAFLPGLLGEVCAQQIPIVSGAAAGSDSLAHKIALSHHAPTIAVIGTGLDLAYPRTNQKLQELIAQKGLLLTEYPLGQQPLPYHFPARNRIIAGLCRSLLVVEAKHHSGSLISANLALQENRNVLAVPGRIDSPASVGCNELIQAGAKPVLSSQDILEDFLNPLTKRSGKA